MADIFISYARSEAEKAQILGEAIERLGLSVFRDLEKLDGGDQYADVLDQELKSAAIVIGLWSPAAFSSDWVKRECAVALRRRVLVPVKVAPLAELQIPVQFFDIHVVDLVDFQGDTAHPGWKALVRKLARALGRDELLLIAQEESHESLSPPAEATLRAGWRILMQAWTRVEELQAYADMIKRLFPDSSLAREMEAELRADTEAFYSRLNNALRRPGEPDIITFDWLLEQYGNKQKE